jgi:hypothetical protein
MRQTRHQPLTVNNNNINALRAKIYEMFTSLVPSKDYKFCKNGKVRFDSLPFYQAGGSDKTGRMFLPKHRPFTSEEKLAFEIIASALSNEGVEVHKKNGMIKGLRLKYIPTGKSYKTEDNIKESVQTEMPLVDLEFNNNNMFVVVKNDNKSHLILSREEIERNIIDDKDFLSSFTIFRIGEQVNPKLEIKVRF